MSNGMTNWPAHFLDAGFTDAEIVEVDGCSAWEYDGHVMRLYVSPAYLIEVGEDGALDISYPLASISLLFPGFSLSLARKAAEDMVCRLHGVPTEAEREVERLRAEVTSLVQESLVRMRELALIEAEVMQLRAIYHEGEQE